MRSLVEGVIGFVSNYYVNNSNLLYYIEHDPKKVLNFIYSVHTQFDAYARKHNLDGIEDIAKIKEEYLKLVKFCESSCSVFLLGECTQEGFDYCRLSRIYNSSARKSFEQVTSTVLLQKLAQSPDTPVYYTAFGCGGLFQDLVIITKTLLKKPNAQLVINIIDRNYTPYVGCQDILSTTRCIAPDSTLELNSVMDQIKEQARQEWEAEDMRDVLIEKEITVHTAILLAKFKQFIYWLTKHFPQARVSCFVHESAQSYLEYCACYTMPLADVIAAADIEDELSVLNNSIADYIYLCIKTMQQKPDSSNLLLARGAGKPCIMSLSLSGQKEYSLAAFKINNITIPVYTKYTTIH